MLCVKQFDQTCRLVGDDPSCPKPWPLEIVRDPDREDRRVVEDARGLVATVTKQPTNADATRPKPRAAAVVMVDHKALPVPWRLSADGADTVLPDDQGLEVLVTKAVTSIARQVRRSRPTGIGACPRKRSLDAAGFADRVELVASVLVRTEHRQRFAFTAALACLQLVDLDPEKSGRPRYAANARASSGESSRIPTARLHPRHRSPRTQSPHDHSPGQHLWS